MFRLLGVSAHNKLHTLLSSERVRVDGVDGSQYGAGHCCRLPSFTFKQSHSSEQLLQHLNLAPACRCCAHHTLISCPFTPLVHDCTLSVQAVQQEVDKQEAHVVTLLFPALTAAANSFVVGHAGKNSVQRQRMVYKVRALCWTLAPAVVAVSWCCMSVVL